LQQSVDGKRLQLALLKNQHMTYREAKLAAVEYEEAKQTFLRFVSIAVDRLLIVVCG
jgi:hypothetical protein